MIVGLLVVWILLGGAASAAACIGIGAMVERLLAIEPRPLESFWFGLAAIVALLETYHLFRPIDLLISVVLLVAGIAGLVICDGLDAGLGAEIRRTGGWACVLYAAILALIALRCAGPCKFFDTGLYGAQTVRWLVTYPVVPGLANLQGRFGFNSSLFLCLALFRHGFLPPLTYRVFDGLLLAVFFAPVLAASMRLVRGRHETNRALSEEWFAALLATPLIYRLFESSIIEDLVGTDSDLAVLIVGLAAVTYLFSALQAERDAENGGAVRAKLLCASALLALATAFKLSAAALAGTCWLVGLWKWRALKIRSWLAYAAMPAAILIPWMAHGAILSGYLFYPSTLFPLPVDWRIPAASAQLEAAGIQAWARLPHAALGEAAGLRWVSIWLHASLGARAEFLFPVVIALFGVLMIVARSLLRSRRPSSQPARGVGGYAGLWLLVPMALALAFWFAAAPALRFGQAALWGGACILGGYGLALLVGGNITAGRCALIVILLAAGWSLYPRTLWRNSFAPLLHVEQFSPLPPPDVVPMESRDGVVVMVARTPGQDWDSALPASDYLTPTLRLRRAGNLAAGFASEGLPSDAEWQASALPTLPADAAGAQR